MDPRRKAAMSALDRIYDDATAAPLGDRLGAKKPSLTITIGMPHKSEPMEPDEDDEEDELIGA